MIIHHMSDGSIRNNIDGVVIPKSLKKVYEMANIKKKEIQNGNSTKSKTIDKE